MKVTAKVPYALSSALAISSPVAASGLAQPWDAELPAPSRSITAPNLVSLNSTPPSPQPAGKLPILPFDWEELDDVDDQLPPILPMKTVGTVRMIPGEVVPAPILPFDWSELDDIDEDV